MPSLPKLRPPLPVHRYGIVATLLTVLLVGLSLASLRPPDAESKDEPGSSFSARHALEDVDVLSEQRRPPGSAGLRSARSYLTDRLTELGGTVSARPQSVVRDEAGTALAAEVVNLHARFPGTAGDKAGTILLMAHYDGVPAGPGAADNAANVASVLEVVRALRSQGETRNTIEVLLTDAEEPGLLGAHAFAQGRKLKPDRTVVVNLEARGVSGPSIMFESGARNSTAVSALGSAGRPIATSLADEVYAYLPNDTDFSEFKELGFAGLNFAFVEGSARYHTAGDSLANLSPASVQHQGDNVLATVRDLAQRDLSGLDDDGEHTYFAVFGLVVHYPQYLVLPLALLAAAVFGAALWYARRLGTARSGVVRAALTFPLPLIAAAAVGFGGWELLAVLRPGYADLSMGDGYHPLWFRAAFLCLTGAAVTGWYVWLRRRVNGTQAVLGIWSWFTLLALATAVLAPGAGYLFGWPVLLGGAALLVALRRAGTDSFWTSVAACAGVLTAVPLMLPVIVLIFPTLGLVTAAVPLVVAALLVALALPLLDLLPRRSRAAGSLLALAAGLALLFTGVRVDAFDADHPRHTSLAYVWDDDSGTGRWMSSDGAPPAWTERLAGSSRADLRSELPTYPTTLSGGLASRAQESPKDRPAVPEVSVEPAKSGSGDRAKDGPRTVRLHIEPPRGTSYVTVFADTSGHRVESAEVLGEKVAGGANRPSSPAPWKWGLAVWTIPDDGLDVTLRVTGEGRIPVRVTSYTPGLPKAAGRLPDDLTWGTYGAVLTDVTVAGTTVRG
ncbi:M20/M25/M40 family metallo-hydrolase [Streptomyces triticagri]|uniref:M20/M25/M40 family metallo-hydrolase n=1 Tax=Streptomyces triticagri TaxID=2293568 RepID=A0A372M2S4_9ACTN|nr:M20/M25/M40 family metallo-hydrolase [Streptomyces triticagri]RFU85216.1 M20/M25/M40 family metallo-hydrolase [Streptomyces triticagri]